MKSIFAVKAVVIAVAVFTLLLGCGNEKPVPAKHAAAVEQVEKTYYFKVEDFVDKSFAILSGSSFEDVARNTIGVKLCKYYNTPSELVDAVINGEADATLMEEPVARKFAANNPDLVVLYPHIDIENYATIFNKGDGGALRDAFNAFLAKIRADGIYEDMIMRWVDSPEAPPMPEITLNPTKKKTLAFATSDCDEPFSYKAENGDLVGFDIELARMFAREEGYGLDIHVMDFPNIIPSVASGRIDFASNLITIKEERKDFVDFSNPVYYGGTVVLTKK
jgi:polar amino acid transport system substrate-binding protein